MNNTEHDLNRALIAKYKITSYFYDILDYPWERRYRHWRPKIVEDLSGEVLELGCGTGRNFSYYQANANVTALDQSESMLKIAKRRTAKACCQIQLLQADASQLHMFPDNHFDHVLATFLCCVMPDEIQPAALKEIARVLKPGGKFKLLEIIYSQNPKQQARQRFLAPLVYKLYGARFDRQTLNYLHFIKALTVTKTSFLHSDTYLMIAGEKSAF